MCPKHQLCKIHKPVRVKHRNNGGSWSPWASDWGGLFTSHTLHTVSLAAGCPLSGLQPDFHAGKNLSG